MMPKMAFFAIALAVTASQSSAETNAERIDRVIGRETIALIVHGMPQFSSVTMRRSGSGTYYCGRVNGLRFLSLPRLAGFVDHGEPEVHKLVVSQCRMNVFVRDVSFELPGIKPRLRPAF